MPVQVYIQDDYIQDLIEFYTVKLKSIKQKKSDLDKEEGSVKASIAQLKAKKALLDSSGIISPDTLIEPDEKEYNSKWIWTKKIEFAIKEDGVPATSNEIVDKLLVYEPSLDRKKAIASVSSNLSLKSGLPEEGKQFIKIDDGTGVNKYFISRPVSILITDKNVVVDVNSEEVIDDGLPF